MDITERLIAALAGVPEHEPEVTAIADLNFDYIYNCPALEGGKEMIIRSFFRELAGAGGIAACGFARLGARVNLLAELGDDPDGRELYEEIARRGVNREGIRLRAGSRTPFTLIFSDEAGGRPRQVASFLGTSSSFTLRPEELEPVASRSALVYSCNYFLLPKLREDIPSLFRWARAKGLRTAYDANSGDGWEDERRTALLREEILPNTDYIFLNEDEAALLTGAADSLEAANRVLPREATAVVKRGARGAAVRHQGRLLEVDAFPLPGPLRDTVGAGDSFAAAFLYFVLCGLPMLWCAALAAANGASTVLYSGGTAGQLDRGGLATFIRNYRISEPSEGTIRVELL